MGLKNWHTALEAIATAKQDLEAVLDCREKSIAKTKLDEAELWLEKASRHYAPKPST